MKNLKKKLNSRSKSEQFFMLTLLFVTVLGIFCVTGCGGKSCETPKCGSQAYLGGTARGGSIPGCGGCLSSGKGCNSACWPQSCKVVNISSDEKDEETDEESVAKITACDTRYYGDGCLGCGQSQKSCYGGCIKVENETDNMNGLFYGSSDSEEKYIGCANGCGGCVGSGGIGGEMINELENITGVN